MTDLAQELVALSASLAWPEPADLADTVTAAIGPRRSAHVRRRVAAIAAGAAAAVSGVLAVSPTARAVASDLVHLRGVHVERVRKLPPALPRETGPLGRKVTLQQARSLALFPIAVPERLGPPDEVWVAGFPEGTFVTLSYESPRALLTEFRGTAAEPRSITKQVTPQNPVETVQVGDRPGVWIEGEHIVFYSLPTGQERVDEPRLAGNTLLWDDGLVLYRLESTLGRDEAIAIGTSLR
jgi:hypothetical protein